MKTEILGVSFYFVSIFKVDIVSLMLLLLAVSALYCLGKIYRSIKSDNYSCSPRNERKHKSTKYLKRLKREERKKSDREVMASYIKTGRSIFKDIGPLNLPIISPSDYTSKSDIVNLIEKIEKKRRLHEKEYSLFLKNLKEGLIVGGFNFAMVVGCCYRSKKARKEASGLQRGDILVLKAEPNNPVDCQAVSVYTYSNLKVGYIEAVKSGNIQEKLLRGIPVKCHVLESEVGEYGGRIHVGLFPCVYLPKQEVFRCYPCDDEEHELEKIKSDDYDNPHILDIYEQNIPDLVDLAEKEYDYIYSLSTKDFMRYIHDHSIVSDFVCYCDNCRWLTHTIYSIRLVNFDVIRVKYTAIDQFNIKFTNKIFVTNWLPFNKAYKEAKQAEVDGEFDLAVQLYKDILNSFCSLSVYYSSLRSLKKYLIDIRAYGEYISFCQLIIEKVNKQFLNMETDSTLSKVIDYAKESEQKTSDLLLKEYSYPISKRISLVRRSISSIVSNLEKVDSTTPELKIKYNVWRHERLNNYLNSLLEEENKGVY